MNNFKKKSRKHFPGDWGRRELKESPFKSLRLSPIKLVPLPRQRINPVNKGDKFRRYYVYHFMYSEERFYGHIAELVYIAEGDHLILESFLRANRINICPINQYSFIKEIGNGAFGTVYLAKDNASDQLVAVKRVYATDLGGSTQTYVSFEIEKESLLAVKSPHVINILSTFQTEDPKIHGIWYVFEYASGGTLENVVYRNLNIGALIYMNKGESFAYEFLNNTDSLDQRKDRNFYFMAVVRYYLSQLLAGVVHLHQQNIIHKDLKPENCLITSQGILKISDFGLAAKFKWFYYSSRSVFMLNIDDDHIVKEGDNLYTGGTLPYMEPELRALHTESHISIFNPKTHILSFYSDYFAVAMIAFEMIFGFLYGFAHHYLMTPLYPILSHYPMMLLLPETYLDYLNVTLTDKEKYIFDLLQLHNIHRFMTSDEDGLIPFVINGLRTRPFRWTKYLDDVRMKRFDTKILDHVLNLDKLKSIPFFEAVNFDRLYLNPGFTVQNLMKNNFYLECGEGESAGKFFETKANGQFPLAFQIPYFTFKKPEIIDIPWNSMFGDKRNPKVDEITHKLFESNFDDFNKGASRQDSNLSNETNLFGSSKKIFNGEIYNSSKESFKVIFGRPRDNHARSTSVDYKRLESSSEGCYYPQMRKCSSLKLRKSPDFDVMI